MRYAAFLITAVAMAVLGCGQRVGADGAVNYANGDIDEAVNAGTVQMPLSGPFVLGTQTHFSQGWPADAIVEVRQAAVPALRDSAPWSKVERTRGNLDFSLPTLAPLRAYCRAGGDLLLTVQPLNPLYEEGRMVSTEEGRAAFANYVSALGKAFRPCLRAIEIGNEINGPHGLSFASGVDPIVGYVDVLKSAYRAIKSTNPDVEVLGGSTNAIGTGFLQRLFRAGALAAMDGVVIHPYRSEAQNVGVEIARLDASMRVAGKRVPIWATEFSDNFPTPVLAAPHLIKMVTLMAAGPVKRAYWYALRDQPWFKNMGLFTATGGEKPAVQAMRLVQTKLLPAGRPTRIDVGDRQVFAYRFGGGPLVIWGAPRAVRLPGATMVRDATGKQIVASGLMLSDDPLIVEGPARIELGLREVLGDSVIDYGQPPFSYLVDDGGTRRPLTMFDDRYASYFGGSAYRPLRISDTTAAPAGDLTHGFRPVLRYTAAAAQRVRVSACFAKKRQGDGVDIAVERHGQTLQRVTLIDEVRIDLPPLDLANGEQLDFVFARHGAPGGAAFRYRVRMLAQDSAAKAICP